MKIACHQKRIMQQFRLIALFSDSPPDIFVTVLLIQFLSASIFGETPFYENF